jgi:hypothetical protein
VMESRRTTTTIRRTNLDSTSAKDTSTNQKWKSKTPRLVPIAPRFGGNRYLTDCATAKICGLIKNHSVYHVCSPSNSSHCVGTPLTKLIVVAQREDTVKSGIERCSATCYAPPAAYVRRLSATSLMCRSPACHRQPVCRCKPPSAANPTCHRQQSVVANHAPPPARKTQPSNLTPPPAPQDAPPAVNHCFPSTATRLPPLAYRQSSVAVSRVSD